MILNKVVILILLVTGTINSYSLDTLKNKTVNYSDFFEYSIEEIKIVHMGAWGSGPVKEIQLKKGYDNKLFDNVNNCLKTAFKDTTLLKTSKKSEVNITERDIDSYIENNPYYPDENGNPDKEITGWMKGFDLKQKYQSLSEEDFQQILTKSVQYVTDSKHLYVVFTNSNNESLTLYLDNPASPFFLPWVINYQSTDIEAHNIKITECMKPLLKETNWSYKPNNHKEYFISCFIRAMYHFEKKK